MKWQSDAAKRAHMSVIAVCFQKPLDDLLLVGGEGLHSRRPRPPHLALCSPQVCMRHSPNLKLSKSHAHSKPFILAFALASSALAPYWTAEPHHGEAAGGTGANTGMTRAAEGRKHRSSWAEGHTRRRNSVQTNACSYSPTNVAMSMRRPKEY